MVNDRKIKQFVLFLKNQRHYSIHTQNAYQRDLQKLNLFLLDEGISLDKLSSEALNLFVMKLHHQGISPRSINRSICAIRGFFKFLQQNLGRARIPKIHKNLPKVLSYEQFKLIAKPHSSDWQELRDVAMIELLYSCALRVSELVGLNINNLDAEFLTVLGKGGKTRSVPIGAQSYQALMRYLQQSSHQNKAVFVNRQYTRLSPRWVQMMLKRRSLEAGIQFDVYPHMLRHASASHFLQSSHDLRTVQDYLGHKSISSTQVYTHLDFQALAKVYDNCHPRAKK